MPQINFATFMIICPTSFFLGLVFSLFPYDYPLLWSTAPVSPTHLDQLEAHLKLLHNAPNLIIRILHIIGGIGLIGLVAKLYKPTESNMLFDGGSLVLYMIALIVYLANIVKGLRMVQIGLYGEGAENTTQDAATAAVESDGGAAGNEVLGREDNLRVLSASNTILALILVGILVLQFGQWYAERAEAKERLAIAKRAKDREREKEVVADAETTGSTTTATTITPTTSKGKGRSSKKTN